MTIGPDTPDVGFAAWEHIPSSRESERAPRVFQVRRRSRPARPGPRPDTLPPRTPALFPRRPDQALGASSSAPAALSPCRLYISLSLSLSLVPAPRATKGWPYACVVSRHPPEVSVLQPWWSKIEVLEGLARREVACGLPTETRSHPNWAASRSPLPRPRRPRGSTRGLQSPNPTIKRPPGPPLGSFQAGRQGNRASRSRPV
jgi:hypothetical protein